MIPNCSFGDAAIQRSLRSCVKFAFLISIQLGTSSIVSKFISLSWTSLDTLLESRVDRDKEHRSPPLFCGRDCPSCLKPGHQGINSLMVFVDFAFSIVRDVSRFEQQLLVSHRQTDSSRCPFKPPTACLVKADFLLVVSPATGIAVPLRNAQE